MTYVEVFGFACAIVAVPYAAYVVHRRRWHRKRRPGYITDRWRRR